MGAFGGFGSFVLILASRFNSLVLYFLDVPGRTGAARGIGGLREGRDG